MAHCIIEEDIATIVSSDLPWRKLEGKTVLVTGAGGFLASYVICTLLRLNDTLFERKAAVIGVVRNLPKAEQQLAGFLARNDFRLHCQDLSLPFTLDFDVDYILHAASPASSKHFSADPVGTLKTNIMGAASLLDAAAARKAEKVLLFSSGEIYGNLDDIEECVPETFPGNVDCLDVRSCYAESKRMAENMCACWARQHGVNTGIIRVGYTYGPGMPPTDDRVVADFVHKVVDDRDIILNSDGTACRSFCYITDMIEAVFRVLLLGQPNEAYNAASTTQTSILELAKLLTELAPAKGVRTVVKARPAEEGYLRSRRMNTLVCTDKIRTLGWTEKVNLRTGLRRTIDSFLQP